MRPFHWNVDQPATGLGVAARPCGHAAAARSAIYGLSMKDTTVRPKGLRGGRTG